MKLRRLRLNRETLLALEDELIWDVQGAGLIPTPPDVEPSVRLVCKTQKTCRPTICPTLCTP
jgi:hypothetical protein